MISLYSRKTETDLTIRKKESMDKYVDLIQWGRKNPTKFIEEIFGIQLIDFQKTSFSERGLQIVRFGAPLVIAVSHSW